MCSRECEWIRIRDEWEVEVGGRSADIMREAVKREIKGFEAKWTDNRSRIIVYWVGIDPGVSYCSKKINSKILHRGFSKLLWRKILLLVTIAVCLRRNSAERRPIQNQKSKIPKILPLVTIVVCFRRNGAERRTIRNQNSKIKNQKFQNRKSKI